MAGTNEGKELKLGRGEIYFARFLPGTNIPQGERYFGSTSDFTVTVSTDKLDHFSSERGVKVKDKSVVLQTNRSSKITTDNIDANNLALFFFGTADTLTTVAATARSETFVGAKQGLYYQLGTTDTTPSGVRKVTNVVVKVATVTKTLGTDYTVDLARGRIRIVPGGSIVDATDVVVTYDVAASTRTRILSGAVAIEGQVRFIAYNAVGEDIDYFMASVSVSPDGDYSIKGGDDWSKVGFTLEIGQLRDIPAIVMDGLPI